jgi:hypothetical protein
MLTNAGPTIVVGTRTRGTRVSSSPSKIPYGGFSPVRLQGSGTDLSSETPFPVAGFDAP